MSHSRGRYEKTSYVCEVYNKHDEWSFLILKAISKFQMIQ